MKCEIPVPNEVTNVIKELTNAGFQAYLIGGCVRDIIRNEKPKDWDITTDASPYEIQRVFKHSFYENDFGTVGVVIDGATDETLSTIEVTPFRIEGKYTDGRKPDSVSFSKNINDDLKRRDFTINSIAYDPIKGQIIDRFGGIKDIKDKIIRSVGNPYDRFSEDYLRMLRAIRFFAELKFEIEKETEQAIIQYSKDITKISMERVRDEFSKIIMSKNPKNGLEKANNLGLLKFIIPEVENGIGVKQNGDHIYDVWEHNLRALQHSAEKDWPLHIRLGSLLHNVSKPETRRWSNEKNDYTFYGHDVVGERVSQKILKRLRYSNEIIEKVSKLVRYHLFFTDIDKITLSAVRRIVSGVGEDLVWDLMNVRACDRIGMGRPKEKPYRLRKYEAMIEEAMRAPVSVAMLKINGIKIMEMTGEKPSPRLGWILHSLLEMVLDEPSRNTDAYLAENAILLSKLSDSKLKNMGEKGKEKKQIDEMKEIDKIRKKHGVS